MKLVCNRLMAFSIAILTICNCSSEKMFQKEYEKARVFHKQNQLKEALQSYIAASEYKTKDLETLALTFYYQSEIYEMVFFDWEECVNCLNTAANIFEKAGDLQMAHNSILKNAGIHFLHHDFDTGFATLSNIDKFNLSPKSLSKYYDTLMYALIHDNSKKTDIQNLLNEYDSPDNTYKNNLMLAWGYSHIGELSKAKEYLPKEVPVFTDHNQEITYYNALINIYKNLSEPYNAIYAADNLIQAIFDMSSSAFEDEVQYVDDSYRYNKTHNKTLWLAITCIIVLCILIFILIFLLIRSNNNKIKVIQETSQNETLKYRLSLINHLFVEHTINGKKSKLIEEELLNYFNDKKRFFKDNRNAIYPLYPSFIERLEKTGLNDEEIEYCCLYVIGLSGKEISELMGTSSHYNLSSTIRKKLGLGPNDTNLSVYIRNLLKKTI